MDEADMYSLNSIQSDILDNVDAKYIVDHLIENDVLEPTHDDEIRAEKTAKRRTKKLLEILPHTHPDALRHLRVAMLKDYSFIVEKLDAVQVPDAIRRKAQPGMGGMRTAAAAAATAAAAAATGRTGGTGGTSTSMSTTTRNNVTSRTTNIRGNNNFVIIGGSNTTINYR